MKKKISVHCVIQRAGPCGLGVRGGEDFAPYGCQEVPRARQSLQAERAERARELEQQWCRKPRRAFTLASSLRAAEADLAAVMTLRLHHLDQFQADRYPPNRLRHDLVQIQNRSIGLAAVDRPATSSDQWPTSVAASGVRLALRASQGLR